MKLKNKLLLGSLTAVLLAVMSFSAWKIWVIRSEYHAGEAAYEDISHMISLPQENCRTTATCHQQASRGRNTS